MLVLIKIWILFLTLGVFKIVVSAEAEEASKATCTDPWPEGFKAQYCSELVRPSHWVGAYQADI